MPATDPAVEAVTAVVQSRALSIEDAWAVMAAARPAIAAEVLREAADWLDSFEGPGGRQSAHDRAGRDVIRLLRARADDLEAGR